MKIRVPNATKMQQSKKKNIGFIVFLPTNVFKMNVLSILKFQTLIDIAVFSLVVQTCCIFSENPRAKMQKTQKVKKKHYVSFEQL